MNNKFSVIAPVIGAALLAVAVHAQQSYPQQPYPQQGNPQTQQQQSYPQQGYPQQQQGYPQQDRRGADRDRQWDAPPQEFDEANRRAFHDGIDAARQDAQSNRPMRFNASSSYRRPPVARNLRAQYRDSFSRGYQVAQARMQRMRDHGGDNEWRHDHDNYNRNYPYPQPPR